MSRADQDKFVRLVLNNKKNGLFLEIGSNDPMRDNNTFTLEKLFGWFGILVESDRRFLDGYKRLRSTSVPLIQDARSVNFPLVFKDNSFPKNVDYLHIDLDVDNRSTLDVLEKLDETVFPEYTFSVVTFAHDIYRGDFFQTREKSRKIFEDKGYLLLFPDVQVAGKASEDWYVHPSVVSSCVSLATKESLDFEEVIRRVEKTLYPSAVLARDLVPVAAASVESAYSQYVNFIRESLLRNDISNFKTNKAYQTILEHVPPSSGKEYLDLIKSSPVPFKIEDVAAICSIADRIGNPEIIDWEWNLRTTPTNLRYTFHSHIILEHMRRLRLKSVDIVEVGAGYGGLCSFMHFLAPFYGIKVDTYTCVDLKYPNMLQNKYLRTFPFFNNVQFVESTDVESISSKVKSGSFLISNYCFSEISSENQRFYIRNLFPKIVHGFMAWNFIPVYNFGFEIRVEEERPNTGGHFNKYVYF